MLLVLALLGGLARAASPWENVNLPGGMKGRRWTRRSDNRALLLTPHFAVRYSRGAATAANRPKADAHANNLAWALERSWTSILGTQGFRLRPKSWMRKSRIPVYIEDIDFLGVASTNATRTYGKMRVDVHQGIGNVNLLYGTGAHEFFHLVQYEHELGEDSWIYDSTAVWMEDKVFANLAKSAPLRYGALSYRSSWNRTYHYPLGWQKNLHGYADAFLVQYLTEQTSNRFVRDIWERMRATEGDNTGAAINAALGGKEVAWGEAFARRFFDFAVANLIRDKNRAPHARYAIRVLSRPLPQAGGKIHPIARRRFPSAGIALFGVSGASLRTNTRTPHMQGMKYDELILPAGARDGPQDIVILLQPLTDLLSGYAAVVARPAGKKWKVVPLTPYKAKGWSQRIVRIEDPKSERLFLVWARPPRSSASNRFTALLLSPPVVKRLTVLEPDPEALPGAARVEERKVFELERQPYEFYAGRAFTNFLLQGYGITWREERSRSGDQLRLQVETTQPVLSPVRLRLKGAGRSVDCELTAVAGRPKRYEGRIALSELDALSRGTDRLAVEIRARDSLGRGLDGRPSSPPEVVVVEQARPSYEWIRGWEGGPMQGAVRGGMDDLEGATIPIRREEALPVECLAVMARRGSEVIYDTRGGALRPLTPGKLELELRFSRRMNQDQPARVRLGAVDAAGSWKNTRVFAARLTWPADGPRGWQTLEVAATALDNTPLDGDPKADGDQPDRSHRLLCDVVPVHLESLSVVGGGSSYYDARWVGGADLARVPNVTLKELGKQRSRRLVVSRSQSLPVGGKGALLVTLRLSRPVPQAPAVRVGGVSVANLRSKKGALWTGEVSLEEVRARVKEGAVPVEIEARDEVGRGLDADPRTVPAAIAGKPWWEGFESEPGGKAEGRGGPDRWHRIETPPRMSYVLLLDASRSMKEQNRLVSAKKAIRALLDQLPADVEMGTVVFFSPTRIESRGFTRDRKEVWKWIEPVQPDDGTPLAAAIDRARLLLANRSHAASRIWRYRIFSDGKETAGGDPVAALLTLDAAIARRRGKTPPPRPPRVPPPKKTGKQAAPCKPQQWIKYFVRVERHKPFDWIYLVELAFVEQALPDGRCKLRLDERPFGVAYGSSRLPGGERRILWRIQSAADRVKVNEATSDQGRAVLDVIRKRAAELGQHATSMAECRKRIDQLVRENLR